MRVTRIEEIRPGRDVCHLRYVGTNKSRCSSGVCLFDESWQGPHHRVPRMVNCIVKIVIQLQHNTKGYADPESNCARKRYHDLDLD